MGESDFKRQGRNNRALPVSGAGAGNGGKSSRAARAEMSPLESRLLLSTTVRAIADAYVWQNTPTTNYGTATTLEVKDSTGTNDRWTYLRFDLTGEPSVDTSGGAILRLYRTSSRTPATPPPSTSSGTPPAT